MVVVLAAFAVLVGTDWFHDPYEMTAETLEFAEVHIWNGLGNPSIIVPVDIRDAQQLGDLQDMWTSLQGAQRIDHSFGGSYDATLVVKFKDARVVLIAWWQSWSNLQADYLERTEYGSNVVSVNAAGARSGKMVQYLRSATITAGVTAGGHVKARGRQRHFRQNSSTKSGDFRKALLSPSCYIVMLYITG